jgi:16S rRNA processing protein RimM
MASSTPYCQAGLISRTHGLKGELKVKLNSPFSFPDVLVKGALMIEMRQKPVPYMVTRFSAATDEWIVKLEGVDTVEAAKALCHFSVMGIEPPMEKGFHPNRLKGFVLIDKNYGIIGEVTEVQEMPSQILLHTIYEGEDVLIPLVDEFILELKPRKKELHLDLPEGLLNLNA